MGACDFDVIAYGKDLKDAFNNAVQDALYEHGHDSYNGTISTTSLIGLDTNAPRYGTKAFDKYLNKRFTLSGDKGGVKKWECYAVEIKGKALKEYRIKHNLQRRKIKLFFFYGLAGC